MLAVSVGAVATPFMIATVVVSKPEKAAVAALLGAVKVIVPPFTGVLSILLTVTAKGVLNARLTVVL